jgi:hypothetical protein
MLELAMGLQDIFPPAPYVLMRHARIHHTNSVFCMAVIQSKYCNMTTLNQQLPPQQLDHPRSFIPTQQRLLKAIDRHDFIIPLRSTICLPPHQLLSTLCIPKWLVPSLLVILLHGCRTLCKPFSHIHVQLGTNTNTYLYRELEQTIVTIYAGTESKPFRFHRILLSRVSKKFKAQFEGAFEEGVAKRIALPDEYSRTIAIFQNWLYSGYLTLPADSTANVRRWDTDLDDNPLPGVDFAVPRCPSCNGLECQSEEIVPWQEDLLLLLHFAHFHDIPLLTREATITWQHMDEVLDSITPYELVRVAFSILPKDSGFCQYLVEQYRFYKGTDWDKCQCVCGIDPSDDLPENPHVGELPQAFKDEVLAGFTGAQYFNWCNFHEHDGSDTVTEIVLCQELRWEQGRYGHAEKFVEDIIAAVPHDENEGMYDNTTPGQWY